MRVKALLLALSLGFLSSYSYAGAKEDFISVVVKQCGKSESDAAKMATPGRTGNVMKLKLCKADSIEIDGCKLSCTDASSKIGK